MSDSIRFKIHKAISSLPNPLEPNTVYFVRAGVGFDLYCTDQTGSIAHQINGVTPASLPAQVRGVEKSSTYTYYGFTNGDYTLDPSVLHPLTVTRIRRLVNKAANGTCTVSFQNNGTNITGLNGLSVTTTPLSNQLGSVNNTVEVGNRFSFIISGATAPINLEFNLDYTEA